MSCLKSLHEFCEAFTVGMPTKLKQSEVLLAEHGNGIDKYDNELNSQQVYCVPVDIEVSGVNGKALVFYDSWNHVHLCSELSEHIDYRAKDAIEKMFAQIKVDMDGNRIRTHNEQTTDGKTFVTFVACIIRSYLLNNLTQYLRDNSTSLKKTLNQLSNITIISTRNSYRFTKALSKKQKQILNAFNADKDILASLK